MTRNWYAVFTRPRQEKKVSSLLSKKGISNYYPLNNVSSSSLNIKKQTRQPLFTSCVFVYVRESELSTLRKIPGVVNLFYWMAKPAVIHEEEIDVLQQFTSVYQNIRLEKSSVNMSGMVRVVDDPIISFKENSATIRFQTLKVILPSLGFTMIAEREKANEEALKIVSQQSFINKEMNSPFLSN